MLKIFFFLGLVSLIITIVLIMSDPAGQLAEANNTKRNKDIIRIINAIYQYSAENQGQFPMALPGPGSPGVNIAKNGADICGALVPEYLENLPSDPNSINGGLHIDCSGEYDTGYKIAVDFKDNKLTVSAPLTQEPLKTEIAVTR